MKTIDMNVEKREVTTRGHLRSLREKGEVPAII